MSRNQRRRTIRRAFTLVELLVVIAIIGIMVGLLLPAVQAARESARRSSCSNNIRQLALALANHHDAKNAFPTEGGLASASNFSWFCYVLPFMDEQSVYDSFPSGYPARNQNYYPGSGTALSAMGAKRMAGLLCPSFSSERSSGSDSPGGGFIGQAFTTHYFGNGGPLGTNPVRNQAYVFNVPTSGNTQGGFGVEGLLPACKVSTTSQAVLDGVTGVQIKDVLDGTSKTLLLVEMAWTGVEPNLRSWVKGTQLNFASGGGAAGGHKTIRYDFRVANFTGSIGSNRFNNTSMGSNHRLGCQVAFGDGSVRFMSEMVDLNSVLLPLCSRAGGEQPSMEMVQ